VSHQHGFGYNGTEPTGSTKPDDSHEGMQQKGENVAQCSRWYQTEEAQDSGSEEFATHSIRKWGAAPFEDRVAVGAITPYTALAS
jgi:hypothetical protein